MGLYQQKYRQLAIKGTKWSKAVGLLAFDRMAPSNYLAANMCYPSRKGKNEWEGDSEIIRATIATTGPNYTGPGGEGCLHPPKGGATATVSACQTATTQTLGPWEQGHCPGGWGTKPKSITHCLSSQWHELYWVLDTPGAHHPFLLSYFSFLERECLSDVCPCHCILEAHFGFMGSQLEKIYCISSLTHTWFRLYLAETLDVTLCSWCWNELRLLELLGCKKYILHVRKGWFGGEEWQCDICVLPKFVCWSPAPGIAVWRRSLRK